MIAAAFIASGLLACVGIAATLRAQLAGERAEGIEEGILIGTHKALTTLAAAQATERDDTHERDAFEEFLDAKRRLDDGRLYFPERY